MQTSKNLEATFIINSCDPELDNKASSLITDFYIRENKGFSYAAWEYGIIKNIDKNYDYFFLIEDDYLPQSPDFYTPFLSKIKDNFYVCELIKDYPCKKHAAISNGLLDAKKALEVYHRNGRVFNLNLNAMTYREGELNQIRFLDLFEGNFTDISDICQIPFLDYGKVLINYGDTQLPVSIAPILK